MQLLTSLGMLASSQLTISTEHLTSITGLVGTAMWTILVKIYHNSAAVQGMTTVAVGSGGQVMQDCFHFLCCGVHTLGINSVT